MNKKGVIFTAISIILSILIVSAYFTIQSNSITRETELTNIKLKASIYYIKNADKYFKNAGEQAIDEVLDAAINKILTDQQFFNGEADFNSFVTACLNGQNGCVGLKGLAGNYSDFGKDYLNFDVLQVTIDEVTNLSQSTAWNVSLEFNYSIIADDGYAEWDIPTTKVVASTSILGRRDPTSEITSPIVSAYKKINYINTRKTEEWNNERALNDYAESEVYFKTQDGVSYLDRLSNEMRDSSCCGIVSLVNKSRVSDAPNIGRTGHIDFRFYKNLQCRQPGLPSLKMFDFWNDQPGSRMNVLRAIVDIDNVTGDYLNETIVSGNIPEDTGMPSQSEYGPYLVNPPDCQRTFIPIVS